MSEIDTISSIQHEYFSLIKEALPINMSKVIKDSSRVEVMSALAGYLSKPVLFTPSGRKQSTFEVAFDEAVRAINQFWHTNAEALLRALSNTPLYAITLETQRFPSRLPSHLNRLSLYFDSVGMVDLLHLPEGDSMERVLHDPECLQVKHQSMLWFAWMLRASESATSDPTVPVFIPLPNTPHSPEANARMHDLAAQYLTANDPILKDITSSDDLHYFLKTNKSVDLEKTICATDAFQLLLKRFGDDDGVAYSPQTGEIDVGGPHRFTAEIQIYRIHELVSTTFACARETVFASLPVGLDPVLYEGNAFLHEWLFNQVGKEGKAQHDVSDAQSERTAVRALVSDELEFLEALSTEDIRKIRENESYRELRKSLSLSRDEFKLASRQSPEMALKAFVAHMRNTIDSFGIQYKQIQQQQKSSRWRTGLSFAGGTSLTALTFAFPAVALLGWLAGGVSVLIGGKSILDLVGMEKEADHSKNKLEESPLMLLYRATLPPEKP